MWPYKFLDESVVIMLTQSLWHLCSEVIFIQLQPGRKETSTVLLWKPIQFSRGTAYFGAMLGKQHFQRLQLFVPRAEAEGHHQEDAMLNPSTHTCSVQA